MITLVGDTAFSIDGELVDLVELNYKKQLHIAAFSNQLIHDINAAYAYLVWVHTWITKGESITEKQEVYSLKYYKKLQELLQ